MSTRDADRLELLAQVEEMVRTARREDSAVSRSIDDARGGYARGGSGEGGRGGGSPTEQAALGQDPARHAADDRIKAIRALHRAASQLLGVNRRWLSAEKAPPTDGPPGCQSCARITDSRGRDTWSAIERTKTTVSDNLPEPLDLCGWCYDRTRSTGKLPTRPDLTRHHAGHKLRVPA